MEQHGSVLLDLFVLFAAAKVLGELFEHFRQPAVVGELLAGVLVGPHVLGFVEGEADVLNVVAELGVIFLLFTVGLETTVGEIRRVGRQASLVGVLGVILPFAAGGALMLGLGYVVGDALFVAAALVATSVGVTARVLRDINATDSTVARVVLAAAVVDDILAMVVLAVVAGLAVGDLSSVSLTLTLVAVAVFVTVTVVAGPRLTRRLSDIVRVPGIPESPFLVAMLLTLGLAAASEVIGLAAIIGAFLAGLIFEFKKEEVAHQVEPVYQFLVPFFFAVTGTRLDPSVFASGSIVGLAALVTVVAVITKVVAGVVGSAGLGRRTNLAIGIGMVPRGEVGLIVASLGLGLGVIGSDLYGVVVVMTLVTTVLTPPILAPMMRRIGRTEAESA